MIINLTPLAPCFLFYVIIDDGFKVIIIAGRGKWVAQADIIDAFTSFSGEYLSC